MANARHAKKAAEEVKLLEYSAVASDTIIPLLWVDGETGDDALQQGGFQ